MPKYLLGILLLACAGAGSAFAGAGQNFAVDTAQGNSPYTTVPNAADLYREVIVGQTSNGVFNQTGSGLEATSFLTLGYLAGTSGTYNLTDKALASGGAFIGRAGTGDLELNRGTYTVGAGGGQMIIASEAGGAGVCNLTKGGATLDHIDPAAPMVVGLNGSGTLTARGGAAGGDSIVNVACQLQLGGNAVGFGTLNLGGGKGAGAAVLTIPNVAGSAALFVGVSGGATVNQMAGGSASLGNNLKLGRAVGGQGSYHLAGGSLVLTGTTAATNGLIAGQNGTGLFQQSGGTALVPGQVTLGLSVGGGGTLQLDGGTLTAGAVAGGAGTSAVNFNGGILAAAGDSASFVSAVQNARVQAGGVKIDTAGFAIATGQVLVHDPALNGTVDGGLTKLGAGVLTLTGNNTYTGGTLVNAGTLLADNTAGSATGSGPVTVGSGGTLGGGGRVGGVASGKVTVADGGALGSGNSPGRLTVLGDLEFQSGGALLAQVGGAAPGAGGYEQVVVNGRLTLGGGLTVRVVNGFAPLLGETFFILDDTGSQALAGTFANAPDGGLIADGAGNTYRINYADNADAGAVANDVSLTVVPEPGTAVWLGGLAAAAWALRAGRELNRRRGPTLQRD